MVNQDKTFHCTGKNLTAYYADSKKHFVYEYAKGPLEDIQLYGNTYNGVQFQDATAQNVVESEILSEYQNKLYKDALHGLKMYSKKELALMPAKHKIAIERAHSKAQRVLNAWKQSIVGQEVDNFLLALFPHSKQVKIMVESTRNYTNDTVTNYQSFAELGISKIQIIQKLIQERILPVTFFNLQTI